MSGETALPQIRRVAVVGAGPVGLAAAKYLLAENCFSIDVYEQQSRVGGAWIHTAAFSSEYSSTPQTNPFQPPQEPQWTRSGPQAHPVFMTPMYDELDTNIPKELMQYSDFPFPQHLPLLPDRRDVLDYIESYSADVKHLIRFEIQVTDVRPLAGSGQRWQLTSKDLQTQQESCQVYDAIAICSGHYAVPYVPPIPGMKEWSARYPYTIKHSKWYRSPKEYSRKKVIVVGNAASGLDISLQVAQHAQVPVLVSQRSEPMFEVPNIKVSPVISEFIDPEVEDRAVRFTDGHVETGIEAIVFATGFLFSFPFMDHASIDLIKDGTRVKHAYQHIFSISNPGLAFLGLPLKVLPFPLSEAQAAVVARVWSGRLKLPSRSDMERWEDELVAFKGDGKSFHTLNFPLDFEYQNRMYDWACRAAGDGGRLPRKFDERAAWIRERIPSIKKAYAFCGLARGAVRELGDLGFDYDGWLKQQHTSNPDQAKIG